MKDGEDRSPDPQPASRRGRQKRVATVREMEVEDLPVVFALGEKLFRTGEWRALRWTWDEYELVHRFGTDGDFCLVAEQDGRLVGFVLGSLLEKRKSAWTYGYVEWLGVAADYARRGIAKALLDDLTARFKKAGARILLVDTDAENDVALAFFRKAGFGPSATHIYLSRNLGRGPARRPARRGRPAIKPRPRAKPTGRA